MSFRRRLNFYLGFLISIGAIVWVLRSVEKQEVFNRVKEVNVSLLLLAVAVMFLSYVARSWRWQFFFPGKAPRLYDSFRCLIVGFFMNNVLPARMGELVRAHLGGRAIGESRTQVLATVAAERLADGVVISAIFGLFFTIGATSQELEQGRQIFYVAYLFGFAALATAVVLLVRHKIFSLLENLNEMMPGHLSTYTLVRIRRFIEGLEPFLRPRRFVVLFTLSFGIWLIELSVYYLVGIAFNQKLSLGVLSVFLAAVNFSSLIPAAPGGIGVIEMLATAALARVGVDRETALAMVAAQHLIQIGVVGLPGTYFFFAHLGGKIPESEPEPDTTSEVEEEEEEEAAGRVRPESDIALSVVIPAYNEEARLPSTLLSVVEYLDSLKRPYEVIVVDDGSSDHTGKVVMQFAKLSPAVRLLTYPKNRGKGFAVRFGAMNARGALVLYNDADGASPIEESARLERAIAHGADIAIGSRAMFSKDTSVKTSLHRKIIGRVFNGIVNFLVLPGIADTQCGFKMFRLEAARYVFSRQKAERFSFDVEVLFLARKAGYKIVEIPINWTNIPGSKVNLVKDSLSMFFDIMRFRFRDLAGQYRNPADESIFEPASVEEAAR